MMLAESRSTDFYADGFDMIYDWEFAPAMSGVFKGGKPADLFSKEAATWKEVPEGKQLLRYTFNHDFAAENAVDTTYGSTEGIMAAYVLTAMLNGTPMIYSSMDADNISGTESFFNYNVLDWSAASGKPTHHIRQRPDGDVHTFDAGTQDACHCQYHRQRADSQDSYQPCRRDNDRYDR